MFNNFFKFNLKSLFLITMVVFCAGMFYAIDVKAETIVVQPCESIQAAINNLPAEGGIIELAAGVHDIYDTIIINKSNVTIQGTHDSEIKLHDSSKHGFFVNSDLSIQLNNITFDGFSVTSSYTGKQGNNLIDATKVDNLTVKNINDSSWVLYFVHINWRGHYSSWSDGLYILNNTIYHSSMTAVTALNAEIAFNHMPTRGADYGMFFEAGNTGISIHDNYLENTGTNGNIQTESANAHIYNNVVKGSQVGIWAKYNTSNILIENNTITGAIYFGIGFYSHAGLKNQTARNNIIYDCVNGISVAEIAWATATGISDIDIQNNAIYNCDKSGIRYGGQIDANWILNIKNNIIANNGEYGIDLDHPNITETHSYNDIWGNTLGDYNGTSAGTGDISIDPLFADPVNEDFHLKSTTGRWTESGWVVDAEYSPCIDAGNPSDAYSNEPSPNGERINMGAYGNTDKTSKSSGACYTYKLVNPGESIQDAIDGLCDSGGTIELASGIHEITDELYPPKQFIFTAYENNTISYSIMIDKSNVTIQGTHDAIVRDYNGDVACFLIPDLDPEPHIENITFKGFNITSEYTWSQNRIISAMHVKNLKVEDIHDTSAAHYLAFVWSYQDYPRYSEDIYFQDIETLNGLGVMYSSNTHFVNNTINGGYIDVNRDNGYVYVHGNYVSNPPNFCLRGHGGRYVYVYDNEFVGGDAGIHSDQLTDSEFYNNKIYSSSIGVYLNPQYKITNQLFRNNIIYNCGVGFKSSRYSYGFSGLVSDADIINNVIYNNTGDGIQMTSEYVRLNIKNNIIANNGGYGINYMDTIEPTSVNHNNIWDNTLGSYNGTSAGTGDISVDPLFASTISGNEDFHLKSQYGRWNGSSWITDSQTSSCIDAGDPLSDYSNEPSLNGDRINIGAYGNTVYASKSSGGAPDTTPPVRSNGSPSGILSYGTTSTTISLTTDENATCKYSTFAGVAYSSMTNTFTTTGTTSHSTTVTGLTNGSSYTYLDCRRIPSLKDINHLKN